MKIVKIAKCHWDRWVLHVLFLSNEKEDNVGFGSTWKNSTVNDDVDDDDNAKTTSSAHNVQANNEFAPSTPIAVKMFMSWHVLSATLIKYSFNSVLSFNIGCERFVPFSFSLIWIPVLKNTVVFFYIQTLCAHFMLISSNFKEPAFIHDLFLLISGSVY